MSGWTRFGVLAGAAAVAVALVGCSPDGGGPASTASAPGTSAAPTTPAPTTPAPTTPAPTTPAPAPAGDADVPVLEGRVAVLVLGVPSPGRIGIDPILFLSGEEAAEAARAHGDEDPPPNDFYIVNDDRSLRDLPVASDVEVAMLMDADGELCVDIAVGCPPMPLADWAASLEGTAGDLLLAMPYWVTVVDGTVTAIEQQYVP